MNILKPGVQTIMEARGPPLLRPARMRTTSLVVEIVGENPAATKAWMFGLDSCPLRAGPALMAGALGGGIDGRGSQDGGGFPPSAVRTASRAARHRVFTVRSEQSRSLAIVFWSAPRYQTRWNISRSSSGRLPIAS